MKMKWNLKVLMAERDIPSATELQRKLKEVGLEISSAQVARVVKEMPGRISTNLLGGLLKVLQCYPNDLIIVEHDAEAGDAETHREPARSNRITDPIQPKPNPPRPEPTAHRADHSDRATPGSDDFDSLIGPRVTAYPTSMGGND